MEHLDEDLLGQLAAGKLPEDRAALCAAHLAECPACVAKHQAVSALLFSKTVAAPLNTPTGRSPQGPITQPDSPQAIASEPPRPLHRGASIGRYVLLEKLGTGGMGEVYAAYDPQLDRKVAVKLLRPGSVSADEGKARLLREAQAMARLSHPNVVAVHDVGTWEDRVFLTMEFVPGETLALHLRENHGHRHVLELFQGAGQGLAAAHRAGLVHRDFKPDNVLIDAEGRARVVDFGLARHQGLPSGGVPVVSAGHAPVAEGAGELRLDSPLTRDGVVLGTPGYMAPEQLAGQPTDARSDQFSFCVALYEALFGQRPFGGETLKAHANEMAHRKPPAPPPGSPVPNAVYEVLVRGLAYDPQARFPDMDALLRALAPKRRGSRVKLVVALGVVSVVATVAVLYSWRATDRLRVCGGYEARLQGVWDDASRKKLKEKLLSVSAAYGAASWGRTQSALDAWSKSWVNASTAACEATKVRHAESEEALTRKTACLEEHLKVLRGAVHLLEGADPEVLTNAAGLVGGLPLNEPCLDAVTLAARERPETDAQRSARLSLLDGLQAATNLHNAGKYAQGIATLAPALANAPLAPPAARAEGLLLLGRLQVRAGKLNEAADTLFDASLAAERSGDASSVARAFSRLSMVVGAVQNRQAEARSFERLAQAAAGRIPQDKEVEAELSNNAGQLALAMGEWSRAYEELQHAERLQSELLSSDHPEVVRTLNNLATALARMGRDDEAISLYQRSYQLHLEKLGPDHPDTASSLHNLGVMYRRDGRLSEAHTSFLTALAIREKALGIEHPETANSLVALAALEVKLDRPADALKHLERALSVRKKVHGSESAQVAQVYDDLAQLQLVERNGAEALSAATSALAIAEKASGADSLAVATASSKVGRAHVLLGQWRQANDALQRCLTIRLAKLGSAHAEVANAFNDLGDLHLAQKKPEQALASFEKARAVRTTAMGEAHVSLAWDELGIGRAQAMLKAWPQAVEAFGKAVQLRQKARDPAELAEARFELGRAQWELGAPQRLESLATVTLARDGAAQETKAQIEHWLQAHGGVTSPR